jgi:predicted amidohydrolase
MDGFPTVKVAAIQATPVILDTAASVGKAIALLEKAAADGVQLALFSECFLSVYPTPEISAVLGDESEYTDGLWRAIWSSSIEVPGPETARLAEACARLGMHCAIGVNERDPSRSSTLYNTMLILGPQGLLHRHRKLMPTNHERLMHGIGPGGDLRVIPTDIGRIGGLICWENFMPMARYTLERQAPEIWLAPTADDTGRWHAFMRAIATESGAFVVSVPYYAPVTAYPADFPMPIGEDTDPFVGGAEVIDPWGDLLAGPVLHEETMVTADCDLGVVVEARRMFDVSGHYSREDVLLPDLLAAEPAAE